MSDKKIYSYEEALAASLEYFNGNELAGKTFVDKYLLRDGDGNLVEKSPDDSLRRLAREFARIEKNKFKKPMTEDEIFAYLDHFKYIVPQGSPLFGVGNPYSYITNSNCYCLAPVVDSYGGIHYTDQHITQLSKRRGGIGADLENLRPCNTPTTNAAKTSTGSLTFAERFANSTKEVGQCLIGSTLILTKNGLKKIKDIKKGEKVWTENGWVSVLKVVKNNKPCIKIKTKLGKELVCSKDHVIHSIDGEKRAIDFKTGDPITQIVGQGWTGKNSKLKYNGYEEIGLNKSNRLKRYILPTEINKELSYVLGYSYGDGSVSKHYISGAINGLELACSNDWNGVKLKLKKYIKNTLGYSVAIKNGDGDLEVYRINSRLIVDFLESNGILKQKADRLSFPTMLLTGNQECLFAFMSGFFDADGSVTKSKKRYKMTSICHDFVSKMQLVLSSFGISSMIHEQDRSDDGWNTIYSLTINGEKSQSIFRKLMVESIKIKSVKFKSKKQDKTRTAYNIGDFGSKRTEKMHPYIISNTQFLSYSTTDRVNADLKTEKKVYLLQDYVKSVEVYAKGEEQEVYDLCLESVHFFSANGLYVHNSGRRGAGMLSQNIHHPESVKVTEDEIKEVIVKNEGMKDVVTTTEYYDPDNLDFATIKYDRKKLNGVNISLRLSDNFMNAVIGDKEFEQKWPVNSDKPYVSKKISAKKAWKKIIRSAWEMGEPGLLFWDNIIKESPADCYKAFGYKTIGTNPCSEIPQSSLSSCILLLLNLFGYVNNPFTKEAEFDFDLFYRHSQIAQRLIDDLVDIELEAIEKIIKKIKSDPEDDKIKRNELELWQEVKKVCTNGRRTGTGITALGDTLAAMGIKYGSEESIEVTEKIYKTLKLGAYRSSVDMAKEVGPFSVWDYNLEKDNPFLLRIKQEDQKLYEDMKKYGRRNIALLTTAPAGTISILTQTSSGIEPVFKLEYTRRKKINANDTGSRVDFADPSGDKWMEFKVYHPKVEQWMQITGEKDIRKSPWLGCTAEEIGWENRIEMQAKATKHIDHAISSTINLSEDTTPETVAKIYEAAWASGCKGITVYRKGCRTGVLIDAPVKKDDCGCAHSDAPKRPTELDAEVYHVKVSKKLDKPRSFEYIVAIGLYKENPYEVFAFENGKLDKKYTKGKTVKNTRGVYDLVFEDGTKLGDITKDQTPDEEMITRSISLNLRHGIKPAFIVQQIEKSREEPSSFVKSIGRALKKYLKDGEKVTGEDCPECIKNDIKGTLVRQNGCISCSQCGWSKCG